ncbi:MAG: GGDEF domain-containing protein [Desulfarculus sp.]|nr:GGDEF domain-containing protein [Desulfarculus sp.]
MAKPLFLQPLPPALEAPYRAAFLREDRRQAYLGLGLIALPLLLMAGHDLSYLGPTPLAYGLLAGRGLLLAGCLALMLTMRRLNSPFWFDFWIMVQALAGVALAHGIRWSRPPDYLAGFTMDATIIIIIFAMLPVRPTWRVWPGLLYTLSSLFSLWFEKTNPGAGPMGTYTTALALAALGGASFSLRLENLRRRHFIAQQSDRRVKEELQHLASTDGLTGLLNRRKFLELAEVEFRRHQLYGHPLAVIIADLDHFKRINDRFGHLTGDLALQGFSRHLAKCVRELDLLGRIGGEEFGLVLPNTDAEQARQVAERIRRGCGDLGLDAAVRPMEVFTVSLGVSEARRDDRDLTQLLDRADMALYQAKAAGRDRVRVA